MTTAFLAVLAGTATYVFGQIILKLWIEPVQEFKKLQGEILFFLTNNSFLYSNSKFSDPEKIQEISKNIRIFACSLISGFQVIPFFSIARLVFQLPSPTGIQNASKGLILLSNCILQVDGSQIKNVEISEEVINSLGLMTIEQIKISREIDKKIV